MQETINYFISLLRSSKSDGGVNLLRHKLFCQGWRVQLQTKVLPFQKLIVWKIELPHPHLQFVTSESLKQLMKSFSHPGESLYSIQSGQTIKHTYVELSQNFLNRQGIVGNTLFDITVKASSNCSVIDYKF